MNTSGLTFDAIETVHFFFHLMKFLGTLAHFSSNVSRKAMGHYFIILHVQNFDMSLKLVEHN